MSEAIEQLPTTNRIEAFSDGVFAIVITLLVLELRVPQIKDELSSWELRQAIVHLGPKFLGFAISFFIIAIFWVNHHQLFHSIKRSTRMLLWLNNLLLLFLTFIPFPTAMMGEYPNNPFAVMFFGATMTAAGGAFTLLRWYATIKARLFGEDSDEKMIRRNFRRSLAGPLLYLTASIVALFSTKIAYAIYIIVPCLYFIPSLESREQKKAEAQL